MQVEINHYMDFDKENSCKIVINNFQLGTKLIVQQHYWLLFLYCIILFLLVFDVLT